MTNFVSSVTVDLPYPNKLLWPNGRSLSKQAEAREFKKHKIWANTAVLAALGRKKLALPEGKIRVHVEVTRKASGVYPDNDNTVASLKAYLDGIAERLGINDRLFETPTITFSAPITAKFLITIGRPD